MRYCPECEAKFRRTDVLCTSCRVRLTDSRGIEGWLPTVTAGLMVLFYLTMHIIASIWIGMGAYRDNQTSILLGLFGTTAWMGLGWPYVVRLFEFHKFKSETSVFSFVAITLLGGLVAAAVLASEGSFLSLFTIVGGISIAVIFQGLVATSSRGGPPGDGGGLIGGGGGDGGGGAGGGGGGG